MGYFEFWGQFEVVVVMHLHFAAHFLEQLFSFCGGGSLEIFGATEQEINTGVAQLACRYNDASI